MDLNQLNYFRVAARMEHITNAAESLHITQPALSKIISRVEEYAGAPLFDRSKGKLRLNRCGQIFLEHVNNIFAELDSGLLEIRRLTQGEQSRISVAASFDSVMFALVERFFTENPGVKLRYSVKPLGEIEDELMSGDLDFAVTSGPINNPKLEWRQISEEEILLTVRLGHHLADRKSVSFAELEGEPLLCASEGDDMRTLIDSCFEKSGVSPNFVLESSELASRNNFSNAPNFAATFIPAHRFVQVQKAGLNADMRAIRLVSPNCTRPTGIARRRNAAFTSDSQRFYDYIWDYFTELDKEVREYTREHQNR